MTKGAPTAPSPPMNAVWRTIRGYILWSYERGTLHYDIMVTLILIFVFASPYVIDFNDKPIARNSHPSGVVVTSDSAGHLIYAIDASAIKPGDDHSTRDQLLQLIESISGEVSIVDYQTVTNRKGKVQSYRVVVKRE